MSLSNATRPYLSSVTHLGSKTTQPLAVRPMAERRHYGGTFDETMSDDEHKQAAQRTQRRGAVMLLRVMIWMQNFMRKMESVDLPELLLPPPPAC